MKTPMTGRFRPRTKWPKNAKQTAFKMDKETWDGLQWLAKRYLVSPSEAARQAIRMLVAVEQKRAKRGQAPRSTGTDGAARQDPTSDEDLWISVWNWITLKASPANARAIVCTCRNTVASSESFSREEKPEN